MKMMKKGFIVLAAGALMTLSLTNVSSASDKSEGYKLVKGNGCLACHAVDQNKVGPAYKVVAQRNKKLYGDKALAEIEKAINKGSKGKYKDLGISAVMPPYNYLGEKKIETIAKWILQQDK